MKKNTFKNRVVQNEDGTRSYKNENLWMHSIDRPVKNNELSDIIKGFAMFIGMGILFYVLLLILGGF